MLKIKFPNNYELINSDDLMEYSGEGPLLTIALYKIASFTILNWSTLVAAYELVDNVSTLQSIVRSWRQKNGTYQMRQQFIPGGNSNIYPPHSYQGAMGYMTYSSVWVKN